MWQHFFQTQTFWGVPISLYETIYKYLQELKDLKETDCHSFHETLFHNCNKRVRRIENHLFEKCKQV